VEYQVSGGPSGNWATSAAAGTVMTQTIAGLTNGSTYAVTVRACNEKDCGDNSPPSNAVIPYGKPQQPNVSAVANNKTITFTWGGGGNNGRPISQYQVCLDGNCTQQGAGSLSHDYGYAETHTISVRAIDSVGQITDPVSASARTADPPSPSVQAALGGAGSSKVGTCGASSGCHWVNFTASYFAPGTYAVNCHFSDNSKFSFTSVTISSVDQPVSGNSQCLVGSGMSVVIEINGASSNPVGG
jgi:hypothetical protein